MAKIKFKDIDIFIEKYFSSFYIEEKCFVEINNNYIFIFFENSKEKGEIKIIKGKKNNFILEKNNFKNKILEELFNKLIIILNNKVIIPLSIRLGLDVNIGNKNVFILGNNGDIDNFSSKDLLLLENTKVIYTNNVDNTKKIIKKLEFNIKVFYFDELYNNLIQDDIVLFFYGEYHLNKNGWSSICKYLLKQKFSIKLYNYYSNFIEDYVLSYSKYGNLNYLGFFDKEKFNFYKKKLIKFLENEKKLIINNISDGKMILKSDFLISFHFGSDLKYFFNNILDVDFLKKYSFEIIYKINNGYVKRIDKLKNLIDLDIPDNIKNINLFVYRTGLYSINKNFLGLNKENKINRINKNFYFLSAPLSGNINEFSQKIIKYLKSAKYIFGETIESVEKFLKDLNIDLKNKKILFGDDLIGLANYYNDEEKFNNFDKVFWNLKKLLDNNDNIYFLTDGGIPCILDPGDYFKKYIGLNYNDYSINLINGNSVIDTVLLSCTFKFEDIYWASFLYTIKPFGKLLKKIGYFDEEFFNDTLFIFYSFGNEFKSDLKLLIDLFGKNAKLQLIGDIGTDREYNQLFNNLNLNNKEVSYIINNLNNIVYLLKF